MSKPFIVLICATDTELDASRKVTEGYRSHSHSAGEFQRLEFEHVIIVIQKVTYMGTLGACEAVSHIIRRYRPICVIGIGICAGNRVSYKNQHICDIVIGKSSVYYEPLKVLPKFEEWRPWRFTSALPKHLLDNFKPPPREFFVDQVPRGKNTPRPQILSGTYACGERVIASRKPVKRLVADWLKKYHKPFAAIDMESAGIAAVCSQYHTKFFMAKAISDFGLRKSDLWQKCAATVSISAAIQWAEALTHEQVDRLSIPSVGKAPRDNFNRAGQIARICGNALPPLGILENVKDVAIDDLVTLYDEKFDKILADVLQENGEFYIGEHRRRDENKIKVDHIGEIKVNELKGWIVDAVDGTQNLVAGRPEVAISIAYYNKGEPEFGIIHMPYRDLIVSALRNQPVEVNGIQWGRKKTPVQSLSEAVVALPGDLRRLKHEDERVTELLKCIIDKAAGIRITGALAYDLGCLALGEIDARISPSAKLVDVAAGICLVEAIGGKVTDLQGNDWKPSATTILAAASENLHRELLKCCKTIL